MSIIAFSTAREGNIDICTVNVKGEDYRSLTKNCGGNFSPDWSPDGKKLVFYSTRDRDKEDRYDTSMEIYIMDANGNNQKRLTFSNKSHNIMPSFSPDGSKIAFCSDRNNDGMFDIFIMDIDGTNEMNVTKSNDYIEKNPDWLDNSALIFERSVGNKASQLFTINIDGSAVKKFLKSNYNEYSPSCSPDRSKIAFSRLDKTGFLQIYIIKSDCSGLKRITNMKYHNETPSWSPDGKRITFSSWHIPVRHLYVVNIDGTNIHQLMPPCPLDDMFPAWSPF